MAVFVFRKIVYLAFVYLLASAAIFLAMKMIPEDPLLSKYGKHVPMEKIEAERERLGLNDSWGSQYLLYHGKFWTGDWEKSLRTGRAALEDIGRALPATIELSLCAMILGSLAGVIIAMYARIKGSFWTKRLALSMGSIGLSVPIFWIGLMALVVFSVWLDALPLGGRFSMMELPPEGATGLYLIDSLLQGRLDAFVGAVKHLILPACCLAVFPMANVVSVLYARLNEPEIDALYVSLNSKGYGPLRMVFVHLLRIAGSPVVTVVGTTFGALLGGAFLTETVFSWPGIGRYLVSAIIERDLFVAQYLLLLLIMLIFSVAFVSDVIAKSLDPRSGEEVEGSAK